MTPTELAVQFSNDVMNGFRGLPCDPSGTLHPEIEWRHPKYGFLKGIDHLVGAMGPEWAKRWRTHATYGCYVVEKIEEGDRVCLVAMGRCAGVASDVPYNNVYMFFMKVRDGKIVEVDECFDGSVFQRSGWNKHLEW